MHELTGYLILAVSCLLASILPLMALVELYGAIVDTWRDHRRHRNGDEPRFPLGGSGFRLNDSGSLLRRRHRRRLKLLPRGRFGFEAKWVFDD